MKLLLFVAVAGAFACGDDPVMVELDENGFAVSLNVDLSAMTETPSGLLWQDFVVGTGAQVVTGAAVVANYSGWLKNGSLFDSGQFPFTVGEGTVIAGWDEGFLGMLEGGTRRLIIPPTLGYGSAGRGSIPPNATLIFDVQLVSVTLP